MRDLGHVNINNFIDVADAISSCEVGSLDYQTFQDALDDTDNIGVEAFYNQSGSFIYATDKFLEYLSDVEFKGLTTDEAQRIKLITYYTFNSIPLNPNWKILIQYRIYAN